MSAGYEMGSAEALQLYGTSGQRLSGEALKRTAAQGLSGTAERLPHLEAIQDAFGSAHDLSGVQAHMGDEAGQAASAMHAKAYATGDSVAFESSPDLRLAAHEAAHIVQQRAGVRLDGGVGKAGDAYERHADAVADRVASGRSAWDLLPQAGAGADGQWVQKYEEAGENAEWRVSDTNKSAVNVTQAEGGQTLLATQDLIDTANAALSKVGQHGSFVRLEGDGTETEYEGNKLVGVKPVFQDPKGQGTAAAPQVAEANKPGAEDSTGDSTEKFALYSDCGRSSRVIMGSMGEAPQGFVKIGEKTAKTARAFNPQEWTDPVYLYGMTAFIRNPANSAFLVEGVHVDSSTKFILPKGGQQAKQQWGALSEEGQRAFADQIGINEAANPEIGGAYTMATGSDLPGFSKVGKMTWNFHWAGVIMKDGADNITLENYAIMFKPTGDKAKDAENRKRAYDWVNKDWVYQMYGTVKEGQTFHEQHIKSGTHGTKGTTFAVKV